MGLGLSLPTIVDLPKEDTLSVQKKKRCGYYMRKGIKLPNDRPTPGSEWVRVSGESVRPPIVVIRTRNSSTHMGCVDWFVDVKYKFWRKAHIIHHFNMPLSAFLKHYQPNTPAAEGLYLLSSLGDEDAG